MLDALFVPREGVGKTELAALQFGDNLFQLAERFLERRGVARRASVGFFLAIIESDCLRWLQISLATRCLSTLLVTRRRRQTA